MCSRECLGDDIGFWTSWFIPGLFSPYVSTVSFTLFEKYRRGFNRVCVGTDSTKTMRSLLFLGSVFSTVYSGKNLLQKSTIWLGSLLSLWVQKYIFPENGNENSVNIFGYYF